MLHPDEMTFLRTLDAMCVRAANDLHLTPIQMAGALRFHADVMCQRIMAAAIRKEPEIKLPSAGETRVLGQKNGEKT